MTEERRTKFMTVKDLKELLGTPQFSGHQYDYYTVLGMEQFQPHSTGVICLNELQEEARVCYERPKRY